MNHMALPKDDSVQGAPRTAGNSPVGLRSMSELRIRMHALFRRIDQEVGERAGAQSVEHAHGLEYDSAVDRFWRGRTVQWSQRG